MKTAKKITLIRFLMIISQLVLTLFVGQWLWAEYIKERDRVDQDFARRFQESERTLLDSMLVVNVLNPMMKDSAYRQLTMNITLDSSDKVFLQGMKLIVRRIEDSLSLPGGYMKQVVLPGDTGRMKALFTGTIREVDPSIKLFWTTEIKPWDTGPSTHSRFYYEMPAQGYRLAATVANPFLLVLKEIFPSLLFALALLILTGLSFVIAFRNLKGQIHLNRIRSDFMSNVTHELKTPVSTVNVALEALRSGDLQDDSATKAEYLEMASREITRLDRLISQVLRLSMYDSGIRMMEKEEMDLGVVVEDAVKIMRQAFAAREAKLDFHRTSEPFIIHADRLHVQGVVINLLENSLNYGGEHPNILVTLDRSDRAITLIVADDGPGIPEEYLEKVFDKFFRVPNGDRHNVKGYGLGLSYAFMVMKLHGGSIRAENIREGGVRFILTFPSES